MDRRRSGGMGCGQEFVNGVVKMIIRSSLYALVASGLIFIAAPFIPSSALIQLKSINATATSATIVRTVTFPTNARMTYEIGNGTTALPDCNRTAPNIHYEQRGEKPLTFDLVCEVPDGDWQMRYCVSARGVFGLELHPTCVTGYFTVGQSMLQRQEYLEQQIFDLQKGIINATE